MPPFPSPVPLPTDHFLAFAQRRNATLAEVGVNHYPRPIGEQSGGSPRVILRAIGKTVRLWQRLRHGTAAQANDLSARPVTNEPQEQAQ